MLDLTSRVGNIFEGLAVLQIPAQHRRRMRTSNAVESSDAPGSSVSSRTPRRSSASSPLLPWRSLRTGRPAAPTSTGSCSRLTTPWNYRKGVALPPVLMLRFGVRMPRNSRHHTLTHLDPMNNLRRICHLCKTGTALIVTVAVSLPVSALILPADTACNTPPVTFNTDEDAGGPVTVIGTSSLPKDNPAGAGQSQADSNVDLKLVLAGKSDVVCAFCPEPIQNTRCEMRVEFVDPPAGNHTPAPPGVYNTTSGQWESPSSYDGDYTVQCRRCPIIVQ